MNGHNPVKYGIDTMVVRRNRIFGFGWVFHPSRKIVSAVIILTLDDDQTTSMPLSYGKEREDVATAFPGNEMARGSGFVLYGAWKGAGVSKAYIEVSTNDGTIFRLNVPLTRFDRHPQTLQPIMNRFQLYGLLAKRVWTLAANMKFSELSEKVKRYLHVSTEACSDLPRTIYEHAVKSGSGKTLIVIDHDLGGGANCYRQDIIQKYLSSGHCVLLLTYHVLSLQYAIELHTPSAKHRYTLNGLDVLLKIDEILPVSRIFYNTAVSFERPEDIPVLLTTLSRGHNIPLTLAVHDYFMVCPSQFLLNHEGDFCGIPDLSVCSACLPHNTESFASLFESSDIFLWRKRWQQCLTSADEILCFSNSSADLLKRAYPSIKESLFQICPHRLKISLRQPEVSLHDKLNIGVPGNINIHKGAKVIQDMSYTIRKKCLPVSITVIGTLELPCASEIVSVTGPYEAGNLPERIEKTKVNILFVPSVCPETFSYVTQELIDMKVPVVCFDLGAPAERIREYPLGLVIPIGPPGEIIKAIQTFHITLQQTHNE